MSVEKGGICRFNYEAVYFFAAVSMFLSAVEYAVPKPLPFLRLGIANLPLILAASIFSFKECMLLSLLKVLSQSLIGGTLFSYVFVFSFLGTFSSITVMYGVIHLFRNHVSYIGVSLAGSMANCFMQLFLCKVMLFGENAFYVAPLLLSFGFATGVLLGIFCEVFEGKSEWILLVKDCTVGGIIQKSREGESPVPEAKAGHAVSERVLRWVKIVCCSASIVFLSFNDNVVYEWCLVAVLFTACMIVRKGKVKLLPSLMLLVGMVVFECIITNGRVLFSLFGWNITQGSVIRGLLKSGRLIGMVFASQILLSGNTKALVPGKIGKSLERVRECFRAITSSRIELKGGNVIGKIDARLCESWVQIMECRVQNDENGDSL